jgi:hypothetical protein
VEQRNMPQLLTLFLTLLVISQAQADVPTTFEADYTEAVLQYNAKKHAESVKLLDALIAKNNQIEEFHELRALNLKAQNRTDEAKTTYEKLIELKTAGKKSAEELAPYHFELGVIQYRAKSYPAAERHLEFAAQNGFNAGPSNFFLAMIKFQRGEMGAAEFHFDEVLRSPADDLKPPARFYLAQIHLKTGFAAGATQNLSLARDSAQNLLSSKETPADTRKIAEQIHAASSSALAPLDKSQWFGNVGTQSAYDSNVLALPDSLASSSATGKSTVKQTLNAGIGYMSSPMNTIQWVPAYRTSTNFNFATGTETAQYSSHFLSLNMTHKPLSPSLMGLKAEGNLTFQKSTDSDGASKFRLYQDAVGLSAYLKTQNTRTITMNYQVSATLQSFAQDSDTSTTSNRSGPLLSAQITRAQDGGSRFWNPSITLGLNLNPTEGTEYAYTGFGVTLSDAIYWDELLKFTALADYQMLNYSKRESGSRSDKTLSLGLNATRKLGRKWALLGDFRYTKNSSNFESSYAYSKFVVSVGASYAIF